MSGGMWGTPRGASSMGTAQFCSFAELQQRRAGLFEVYVFSLALAGSFFLGVWSSKPTLSAAGSKAEAWCRCTSHRGAMTDSGLLQASCLMGSNCLHSGCGSDGGWHRSCVCRCSAAGRFLVPWGVSHCIARCMLSCSYRTCQQRVAFPVHCVTPFVNRSADGRGSYDCAGRDTQEERGSCVGVAVLLDGCPGWLHV